MCDTFEQIRQKDSRCREYMSMNTCYACEQIEGISTRQDFRADTATDVAIMSIRSTHTHALPGAMLCMPRERAWPIRKYTYVPARRTARLKTDRSALKRAGSCESGCHMVVKHMRL